MSLETVIAFPADLRAAERLLAIAETRYAAEPTTANFAACVDMDCLVMRLFFSRHEAIGARR
jgi:hypothetical protein